MRAPLACDHAKSDLPVCVSGTDRRAFGFGLWVVGSSAPALSRAAAAGPVSTTSSGLSSAAAALSSAAAAISSAGLSPAAPARAHARAHNGSNRRRAPALGLTQRLSFHPSNGASFRDSNSASFGLYLSASARPAQVVLSSGSRPEIATLRRLFNPAKLQIDGFSRYFADLGARVNLHLG